MHIGLTQRILIHNGFQYDCIEHSWHDYLRHHEVTFIENNLDQDFNQLANSLDGLIISGGDDSSLRRTVELKLASIMLMANKPILGICHGAFLLTDVLGGKVESIENHYNVDHDIIYNNKTINVNSYHGIAIKSTHDKAQILATDNDGNCEAWIDKNIAAIVWHPERMKTTFVPDEILNLFGLH